MKDYFLILGGYTNILLKSDLEGIESEQIRVEMRENLVMEFWRMLIYMLPLERVERAIEEFAEMSAF
ncbi:hypothetical protein [Geoglobus acetivorans]